MSFSEFDILIMKRCLNLAKMGRGLTSPNPMVGCVIVKGNKIISEGYHLVSGKGHAEYNAVKSANKEDLVGATLYCNLEPCTHYKDKKTVACSDIIKDSKISKVIFGTIDPNPNVNGKGLQNLIDSDIIVQHGLLREKCIDLNEIYFSFHKNNRPFIHLKSATTLDGRICSSSGDSKWISNEKSRTEVHSFRHFYDCIIVGRETVNKDNPQLNIRMVPNINSKNPKKILVGNPDNFNKNSQIFTDSQPNNVFIVYDDSIEPTVTTKEFFEKYDISLIPIRYLNHRISTSSFMDFLKTLGITSALVEGGSNLISSFIDENIYDLITLYISNKILGNGTSWYENLNRKNIGDSHLVNISDVIYTDDQLVLTLKRSTDCLQA